MNTENFPFESLFWKVLRLNLSLVSVYQQVMRQPIYAISERVYHVINF